MSVRLFEVDIADEDGALDETLSQLQGIVKGDPHGRIWLVLPGPNGWPTAFVRVSIDHASLERLGAWAESTAQGPLDDIEVPVDTPLPYHRRAQ